MDTNNEMLMKFFEMNKNGMLTDEEFAALSKAVVSGMTKERTFEQKKEENVQATREHAAQLREKLRRRAISKQFESDSRTDMLFLASLLDRYGNRAYTIEQLSELSFSETQHIASEVRDGSPNAKFRPLDENEQKEFLEKLIDEKDRKDFKFDYNFPTPKWMEDEVKSNNNAEVKEERVQQPRKLTEEEIAAKKKEIADKLYAEAKKKDKERQMSEKTEVVYEPETVENEVAPVQAEEAPVSEPTPEKTASETTNENKDRSKDIESMAQFQDASRLETDPKSRHVKGIRGIGEAIKNHPKIVAGGAVAIAAVATFILNPALLAAVPAGLVFGYAGKQVYDGRKGK